MLPLLQLTHEDTSANPSALENMTLNATKNSRDVGKEPNRKKVSRITVAVFCPDAVLPGLGRQ